MSKDQKIGSHARTNQQIDIDALKDELASIKEDIALLKKENSKLKQRTKSRSPPLTCHNPDCKCPRKKVYRFSRY